MSAAYGTENILKCVCGVFAAKCLRRVHGKVFAANMVRGKPNLHTNPEQSRTKIKDTLIKIKGSCTEFLYLSINSCKQNLNKSR